MDFSDLSSALIIASIIIWARWCEVSLERFISFLTKSFEIINNENDITIMPTFADQNEKQREIVNNTLNKIQLYFASTYTMNVLYSLIFIGLIIFSSPISAARTLRNEHFKSYNYITYVTYLWILVSMLSHFPLLHELMEIQLSLFPYFLFITLAIVTVINVSLKLIFHRKFVFRIGIKRRFYEVLHSSALISILCSMLYGECEYYNYHNSDVCKLLLINIQSVEYHKAIILTPVLRIWLTGISIICVNYLIEGLIVERFILSSGRTEIEPKDTHPMVTWFSLSHTHVLLDLLMQLGIFVNRFDRRMLNASFLNSCKPRGKKPQADSLPASEPVKLYRNDSDGNFQTQNYSELPVSPSRSLSYEYSKYDESMKDMSDQQQSSASCFTYLKHHKDLWFDFMADCGDGFNSSYEVARLLAQPYLLINENKKNIRLPRGKLLLIGGDLAYAGPSIENYEKKFFRVFEDAMNPPDSFKKHSMICRKPKVPENKSLAEYEGPTSLIIPGNHDWYDGLSTFHRLICCRSWLGNWLLPQSHTYFSLKLAHNWWIFGVDYALNDDIDSCQFQYFSDIVNTYFVNGNEKIIIITHEPGWISQDHKGKPYGSNLKYLIEAVIGKDKLKLRLSGDLHNYTRHEIMTGDDIKNEDKKAASLVVSGGGGAFLHATHCPYKRPIKYHGNMYCRVKEYPSIWRSKWYSVENIIRFRSKNLSFDLVGGMLYYSVVFSCFPLCNLHNIDLTDYRKFLQLFVTYSYDITKEIIEESYVSLAVLVFGAIFCYLFTDKFVGSFKKRVMIAILHMLAHYTTALFVFILAECLIVGIHELHAGLGDVTTFETFKIHFKISYQRINYFDNTYFGGYGIIMSGVEMIFNFMDIAGFHVLLRNQICSKDIIVSRLYRFTYHCTAFLFYFILAAPWSAFILGVYLAISLNYFGKFDEGFSSLRIANYKNFLRFHLNNKGHLTCYAIGIDTVPIRWKLDNKWSGNNENEKNKPSYLWKYPSKWIPDFKSGDYFSLIEFFFCCCLSNKKKGQYNMNKKYEYRKVKIIDKFELK